MTAPATTNGSSHAPAGARDPVLAALERIEHRLAGVERDLAAIAPLAAVLAAAPGGIAMVTDTIDSLAGQMQDAGVDLDAHVRSATRVLKTATSPRSVDALVALMESRLLDPAALDVVGRLAIALAEPGEARPAGAWGLMRALRDPDVQRAVGFLLAVARTFGRELKGVGDRAQLAGSATLALEAP